MLQMRNILPIYLLATVLLFSVASCSEQADTSTTQEESSVEATPEFTPSTTGVVIAYINTDSIRANYKLYKELEEELLQERLVAENQFNAQVSAFEKDYTDAQREAASLSQEGLAILQRRLQTREQELMQQKQVMEGQLIKSEEQKLEEYTRVIKDMLKDYSSEKGIDVVMAHGDISNLLYINEAFDVTSDVIQQLNAQYDQSQLEASK